MPASSPPAGPRAKWCCSSGSASRPKAVRWATAAGGRARSSTPAASWPAGPPPELAELAGALSRWGRAGLVLGGGLGRGRAARHRAGRARSLPSSTKLKGDGLAGGICARIGRGLLRDPHLILRELDHPAARIQWVWRRWGWVGAQLLKGRQGAAPPLGAPAVPREWPPHWVEAGAAWGWGLAESPGSPPLISTCTKTSPQPRGARRCLTVG